MPFRGECPNLFAASSIFAHPMVTLGVFFTICGDVPLYVIAIGLDL